MTSAVWTVILSLMQGRFDSKALEGSEGPLDEKTSAHFAALQMHAGIPVRSLPTQIPGEKFALSLVKPPDALQLRATAAGSLALWRSCGARSDLIWLAVMRDCTA